MREREEKARKGRIKKVGREGNRKEV